MTWVKVTQVSSSTFMMRRPEASYSTCTCSQAECYTCWWADRKPRPTYFSRDSLTLPWSSCAGDDDYFCDTWFRNGKIIR